MADRKNTYYRQLVTEADLDEMFDQVEAADQNYVVDNGQVGVYFGLDIAEAGVPNLTIQCAAGSAYDQTGQRIAVPATQIVDVSVDTDNVSTTVAGGGNSKIVSVFIQFDRALSNPKTDGNNVSVQYDRDESYTFIVEQSAEGVGPTAPALKSDAILLADITRTFGVTTIEDAAISTARRQWAISATSGGYEVREGRVEDAIQAVLDHLTSHTGDSAGAHAASAISNTPAGTIAATTVQAAIDELGTEKGGLATSNTWTAANSFMGTTHDWLNPTGTLRTHKRTNGTAGTGFTLSDQRTFANVLALGTSLEILAASLIPNNCRGTISLLVTAGRVASIDNYASMSFVGAFKKTGDVVTVTDGAAAETSYGATISAAALEGSGGTLGLTVTTVGTVNIEMSFTVSVTTV